MDKDIIEKAYKVKAIECHPDKNINNKEFDSETEFKKINEAYNALLRRYTKKR